MKAHWKSPEDSFSPARSRRNWERPPFCCGACGAFVDDALTDVVVIRPDEARAAVREDTARPGALEARIAAVTGTTGIGSAKTVAMSVEYERSCEGSRATRSEPSCWQAA